VRRRIVLFTKKFDDFSREGILQRVLALQKPVDYSSRTFSNPSKSDESAFTF
jgi:hypothetical protein